MLVWCVGECGFMQVVKEFPYLAVSWDPDGRSVVLRWRGGFTGRNLSEGLNAGLRELELRRPHAQWIGDATDIGVIGEAEKSWVDQDWFPRFLATGVRYMAVVQPKTVVARLSVSDIVSRVPGTKLTVYNCASLDVAVTWMKSQEF